MRQCGCWISRSTTGWIAYKSKLVKKEDSASLNDFCASTIRSDNFAQVWHPYPCDAACWGLLRSTRQSSTRITERHQPADYRPLGRRACAPGSTMTDSDALSGEKCARQSHTGRVASGERTRSRYARLHRTRAIRDAQCPLDAQVLLRCFRASPRSALRLHDELRE